MKVYSKLFDAVSYVNGKITCSRNFIETHKVSKRFITLTLLLSLLMPALFFGDWAKTAAASLSNLVPTLPQAHAPNAAPPVPFTFSSSDTLSAKFASSILTINTSVANGLISTANFFTTPHLPEGFEAAKPISPATALLFSVGDSFKSFFGFFSTTTSNTTIASPPPVPLGSTSFDYNGDGYADVARFRSSTGAWEIKYSGINTTATGTLAPGKLAPADYDGDGSTDLASFNNGTWTIRYSSTGQIYQLPTGFGQAGDIPVSGNYIGTVAADLAVWRPSNGMWYVREIGNATITSQQFGQAGDIPVPGNYDGQGYMDYAVFRPNGGVWHILGSNSGYYYAQWGVQTDIPTAADFDGDGKTDMAVYRPSSGAWYSLNSGSGGGYIVDTWGNYGDQPAPADYNADGKADFSVYRPTSGVWHTKKSTTGTYEFTALGTPQDMAATSAYIRQVGGQVATYDMAKTRLAPKNATGGTDLYSRNFGWSSPLVGLSGRSGLDMGFGISYNSLIWTKHTDPATSASTMYFDVDNSNISPGFRFGFPTIEPIYYSDESKDFSYMMISPSGARTEFKQKNGASDTFETVDSSYVQLKIAGAANPNDPVENITITVTGTDGTKMTYAWKGGAFRVSEIKDRNGNYITIAHDNYGLLQSVTDTLGRVVTVEYDSQLYPTAIKQTWKDEDGQGASYTYYWARFEYTIIAVNPTFVYTLPIYGPAGGAPVKVLSKIKRADDSSTVFEYQQNSFGQVSKIRSFAPDNHELNYMQTNLVNPGTNLTDCPRLSQTRTWAENFNSNQEVIINNSLSSSQSYSLPDGHNGMAAKIEVTMVNHPYGAVSKTFVGESGWMEALPIATEDWATETSGLERKRWTWTGWTQDNTNLSYLLNPRPTESKVGDAGNVKKMTVEYLMQPGSSTISHYGLTKAINVYDTDQTTVKKRSETEYNLDSAYISRRIIGLPSETRTYGLENSTWALASKTTLAYDEENFSQESNQNISSVIQHDNINFSTSFIEGRGNLTSTTRHDVLSSTASITTKVRYDIAGSTVAQLDPLNRKVRIEYSDNFNDTTNSRNTFAYPTKVFDPANNYSEVKYRFDMGANVWSKSPAPAGNTVNKETVRNYDSIGRLLKETLSNTGAYTRYEYSTNALQSKVYSIVNDTNGNGVDSADEVYSESWTDGAGRTLRSRTSNPDSLGGWTGSLIEYDILGRVKRSTVPTEISVSGNVWTPTGDDNRGLDSNNNPIWLWMQNEYDWKSRVTREINPDGTDTLKSYDGCGCAGGQVTTVQSELVPRDDDPSQMARRKQKIYEDILGRTYKVEVLKWDNTVYSTIKTAYNSQDQEISTTQFDGDDTSSAFQTTVMTYDGYGRLKTHHRPEQQNPANTPAYTIYNYNADDSIRSETDARGVTTNYAYNSSGLLSQLSYSLPQTMPQDYTIPATSNITFSYDSLGNRTQMTDSLGSVSYSYNELSQIVSETRQFTDSLPYAPLPNNGYKVEYSYTLNGQLKSVKDPFGQKFNYSFDNAGRLKSIAGDTSFGGVTNYISDIKYRAWNKSKGTNYGNGVKMTANFNLRLNAQDYTLTGFNTNGATTLLQKEYQYYDDGHLKYVQDVTNPKFDRLFRYNFALRLTQAKTGAEARGQTETNPINIPFRQNYSFNSYGNMTQISGDWKPGTSCEDSAPVNKTYVNNRNTSPINVKYDADGRTLREDGVNLTFDARGKTVENRAVSSSYKEEMGYDGNGQETKRTESLWDGQNWQAPTIKYYVRATALGGRVISETNFEGKKESSFVYAGDEELARQQVDIDNNSQEKVTWRHYDASRNSMVYTKSNGYITNLGSSANVGGRYELSPTGKNANYFCPVTSHQYPNRAISQHFLDRSGIQSGRIESTTDYSCFVDGVPTPCDFTRQLIGLGGESVGDIVFFDMPVFSDLSGRTELDAVQSMLASLRQVETDESVLISATYAGVNDSSLTVGAGDPIYKVVYDNASNSDKAPPIACSDFIDCLKKAANQVACDRRLSRIFGDGETTMATVMELPGLVNANGTRHPGAGSNRVIGYDGKVNLRESPTNGNTHLYSTKNGQGREAYAYTPPGYSGTPGRNTSPNPKSEGEVQTNFSFVYLPGSLSKYGYNGGLRINFVHSGTTNNAGELLPPTPSIKNSEGSIRVGIIGNYGSPFETGGNGTHNSMVHDHMLFNVVDKRGNMGRRIDPREVFCSDLDLPYR